MAKIDLHFVAKKYDDFRLHETTLHLPSGSFTVLLGPSGSGKSTLLRLIAGLETPDAGFVLLDGEDVTRKSVETRGVGLVFQDGALFPHLSVAENVAFGLRVAKVAKAERARRVGELLALVDLEGKGERRVARLSGGERQRVALARALAVHPRVLLMDEPLASLDRNLREELRGHLRRLHDRLGLTTVLVTHDREEALALADRLVLMREGAVVEEGAPREMFRNPRTPFAARFLGGANVLPDGTMVRVEDVRIERDVTQSNAVVVEARFAGFHEELKLRMDEDCLLDARAPVGEAPRVGERVRASWR